VRDGRGIPALAPAWTDDGGHLNVEGRRMIAEQFLVFLAGLAAGGDGAAASLQAWTPATDWRE
jgi:hypothetical protein